MKKFRKVLSLVLALALVFGLSATAFAASTGVDDDGNLTGTTGSITINGAIANETYTIYQIFELTFTSETDDDGNVTATGESYSYKVCDGWADFLATQTVNVDGNNQPLFTLTEGGYLDPDSLIFSYYEEGSVVTDEVIAALARAALDYATTEVEDEETGETSPRITGTSVSYSYTVNDNGDITATLNPQGVATIDQTSLSMDEYGYVTGSLTFSGLPLGYYLVGTSLGSLCMLDSTDPDAVVNEKNSTPTISKHVYNANRENTDGNDHEDHENNNTTVTYELDVEHITGAVNLVIHDSQPSEIEEDWTDFHPTVTLVVGEGENGRITLNEGTDYTIVLTGADETGAGECSDPDFDEEYGCTFEIDFTGYDFSNVSDSAYIEVIYTGELETDGDIYVDDVDEIDNFAVVTFGASSASPVVEAEVYSFGFEVYKYTESIPGYSEVIVATFSNDNPEEAVPSDELYLMLFNETGTVDYYATFDLYDADQNIYVITGWVTDEGQASSITEPDYGTDEQTAYFYVPNDMTIPEHSFIQLDEDPDNPVQETNDGAERVSADEFSQPLANAVFQVSNASGQTAYFTEENVTVTETDEDTGETTSYIKHIYLFEGWGEIPEGYENTYTTSVTSGSDGMIYIDGLDTGTYIVTEIAAPDGYNLLDGSIEVTIWATYVDETGAIDENGVSYTYNGEEGEGVVNVLNSSGTELPGTGGIGTTWFYIIGAILVVGAAVVLVTRRRVNAKAA